MKINKKIRDKLSKEKRKEVEKELELKKKKILRMILTPKARSRLTNIKLARPEYAKRIETQLIQLAQLGKVEKLTDKKFKEILKRFAKSKKKYKLKRLF